mgnify:CR=1 FL=1
MSFSPNLFLSHMRSKDGPAKPSRFEVILPIPAYINQFVPNNIIENLLNLPNAIYGTVTETIGSLLGDAPVGSNATLSRYLALQCETAELPGRTLQTQDVKIYGPTFKVPYQTQYNETTFTFLCTNDFYERKLFDKWIEAIMPNDTNNLRFPKGKNSTYLTKIRIIQYDDTIKQIYAVDLIDAFPIGISPQALSWAEEGFHRLAVQFAYQKYETIYEGSYDFGKAAASALGVLGTRMLPTPVI